MLTPTILQTQRDVILTLAPARTQEEGGRPSNWQTLKGKYSKSLQTMLRAAESKESLWPCTTKLKQQDQWKVCRWRAVWFEESPSPTAHRFSHSPAILATCQFHLCFTACPQYLIKIKADLCHYNAHNRKRTQRPSVSTATLRGAGASGWRSKLTKV